MTWSRHWCEVGIGEGAECSPVTTDCFDWHREGSGMRVDRTYQA